MCDVNINLQWRPGAYCEMFWKMGKVKIFITKVAKRKKVFSICFQYEIALSAQKKKKNKIK